MHHTRAAGGGRSLHSHMWIFGLGGLALGGGFLVFAPQIPVVSKSILLFAGFHLVGAVILLATLYFGAGRDWLRRLRGGKAKSDRLDFGWGPGWMNGLALVSFACLAGAILIEVAAPGWWPAAFALVGLAANFLAGNSIMRGFRRVDQSVLPLVRFLPTGEGRVLDAGCGAGRTSIAVARALTSAQVFAVDRFDADYIDDGGRDLLARNLALSGVADRVSIEQADLTALPFAEGDFDGVVSTHVYDHLGVGKQKGLDEAYRVLKPGGRFLMGVWVPGWSMFTIGAVLSFFLTSKAKWREMAKAAGFELEDEQVSNHAWFLVMRKPVAG